jgi:hypothetical protein
MCRSIAGPLIGGKHKLVARDALRATSFVLIRLSYGSDARYDGGL